MNPYEEAVERFNRASRGWQLARTEAERLIREADEEYNAAFANLARHESKPGIPLPEYRQEADDAIAEKQFEHRHITSDGTFADND